MVTATLYSTQVRAFTTGAPRIYISQVGSALLVSYLFVGYLGYTLRKYNPNPTWLYVNAFSHSVRFYPARTTVI